MNPESDTPSTNEWMQAEDRLFCGKAAALLCVSPEVHPNDFIFQFLYHHPSFATKEDAINRYFEDGAASAKKVRNAIDRWIGGRDQPLRILEFASGYGCVTRHAKKELEHHGLLTSCDIHPQAIEFLSNYCHVKTLQSQAFPEALDISEKYDVIFVLSFFTHMPRETWFRWLEKLYNSLAIGGIFIFTTHGKVTLERNPDASVDEEGYWFVPFSEQSDLDGSVYGSTITLKKFVDTRIASLQGADYLYYEEAAWWTHQDVYILRKV